MNSRSSPPRARSSRAGPLIAFNCAAVQDTLAESELFGHERGAFTGAHADKVGLLESAAGGTLFLDEVAELSPGVQAKLLRVLENRCFNRVGAAAEQTVDVRIVAATNRDLLAEVEADRFRRDLYYRLSAATVWLRVGNTLVMQAVDRPASARPSVARSPAPPAPTTTTS